MNSLMRKAKDIMQREVIKVYGSMTVTELARLFDAEHISGAPVVEGDGKLIGVVSDTDLVRNNATRDTERAQPYGAGNEEDEDAENGFSERDSSLDDPEEKRVEEIMTPWTVLVREDATIAEIAKTMVKQRIHRVFITDQDARLKGIVTTMDLVKVLAEQGESETV